MRTMIGLRVALVALAAAGLIAAGCGDDDDGDESGGETTAETAVDVPGADDAAALQEQIADLSDEEQIARVGEAWAEPFAAGDEAMCAYLHPDLAPESCVEAGYLDGALTGSTELQSSYAGAKVESVEIKGREAVTKFSNGERVEFQKDSNDQWKVASVSRAG